jgi:hypothetical protein
MYLSEHEIGRWARDSVSVEMVVRSDVADFDAWKVVFDGEGRALHEEHGATGHRVYHDVDGIQPVS